ncbi:MAG TPA: Gfo/Idh/MocA family oxidoreductase [Vicinamibacteria bacterium]|nr:Gfo/Idh/MocA family oxidoreductase [Vicinamibacteria bacterium]
MDDTTRRRFLKTAGAAGAALAALPARASAQGASKTTLALLGCAHIHVPGFAKLLADRPDVRVKWAWDPEPARVAKWGGVVDARTASSVAEVLADPEVKGVVILSETSRHRELVEAAAKAGKHLFVEKPLAATAAESRAMAEAIERASLLFTTGYFMRTDPKLLFLREQVAKGAFGRITRASAWNCHEGALGGWFDEKPGNVAETWRWMADPKIAGVGAFGDLGTHSLDVLMWTLGPVESVNAEVRVITGRYGDCDETGTAMLRLRNGLVATLVAGWVDVANPVTLQIAGTEGHAIVFRDQLFFESAHAPGSKLGEPVKGLAPGPKAPLQQWVDAVGGATGQPLVTPREAADRVAVMEAAYASARTGRWVGVTA